MTARTDQMAKTDTHFTSTPERTVAVAGEAAQFLTTATFEREGESMTRVVTVTGPQAGWARNFPTAQLQEGNRP